MGSRHSGRRLARRTSRRRRRAGRIRVPARMVSGWRPLLRLRQNRLVEHLPRARLAHRGDGADDGRVRRSRVGARLKNLRVRVRRADRLPVRRKRFLETGDARHSYHAVHAHRNSVHRNVARRHKGVRRARRLRGWVVLASRRAAVARPRRRRGRAYPSSRTRSRGRRLPLRPAAHRVRDDRRQNRPRLLLPRQATPTSPAPTTSAPRSSSSATAAPPDRP